MWTPRDELSKSAQLRADTLAEGNLMLSEKSNGKPSTSSIVEKKTAGENPVQSHSDVRHGLKILRINEIFHNTQEESSIRNQTIYGNEINQGHSRKFYYVVWTICQVQGPRGRAACSTNLAELKNGSMLSLRNCATNTSASCSSKRAQSFVQWCTS